MSENYLIEAFKELEGLNEEIFSFDVEGTEKLKQFMDGDYTDELVTVIDPEAENEEDLKDSYVGKVILHCSICGSDMYKDPQDVKVDEESQLANVGEECPMCMNSDGYTIIGEVSEYDEGGDDYHSENEEEIKESPLKEEVDLVKIPGTVAYALHKELDSFKDAKSISELKKKMADIIDRSEEIKPEAKEKLKKKLAKANNLSALGTWLVGIKATTPTKEALKEDWSLVYDKFTDIINKYFPDEKKISLEVEKLYTPHKGEKDWDEAWEKWTSTEMNESIKKLKEFKSSRRDDIDADADDKKEKAKKVFARKKDDADADKDYKLKKAGLREPRQLKEASNRQPWRFYVEGQIDDDDWETFESFISEEEAINYAQKGGDKKHLNYRVTVVCDDEYDEHELMDMTGYANYETIYTTEDENKGKQAINEESNLEKLKKAYPELDLEESKDLKNILKVNLKESDKRAALSIEDCQKYVDYDMKYDGKISRATNNIVKRAGFQIIKDQYGDYEVAARDYEESLKEDFRKVDIETDETKMSMTSDEAGKVTVTTEPTHLKEKEEFIAPVSDELKAEIESNSKEDEEEIDVEEFDEESFDELGESYLKKVYENVNSYKTTQAKIKGNSLILEGIIEFNSGKKASTKFLFESHYITSRGKLKFIGTNPQITESSKPFTITGSVKDKKLLTEALTYNYKVKGQKDRIYGTVRK